MHRFVATEAFERDYDSALANISYDLGSPRAAAHMMDAMDRFIGKIAGNPHLSAVSAKPMFAALGYREEFVGNYVLLYAVEGDRIVAKRLFPMSQDYESYV